MKILMPALCQQGQVYSSYWLSTLQAQTSAQAYNGEIYKRLEQELTNKIIALIPGFSMENQEHVKLLQNSRALPQNQQQFTLSYQKESIELHFYAMSGESLLARGRNHSAQVALTGGYDKLFFIDCDENFTFDDVLKLAKSPYPIAAGVVPLKTFPDYPRSFETSLNFLPFLEDEIFFDDSLRTLKSTLRMARAKRSEWVKVAFTGTGFMCIDVSVFQKLAETCKEYMYPSPTSRMPQLHWSFFDGGPLNETYLSEDWELCDKIRTRLGLDIMVNVNVRAGHTGPHTFVA